jgi:hypothetical protein
MPRIGARVGGLKGVGFREMFNLFREIGYRTREPFRTSKQTVRMYIYSSR